MISEVNTDSDPSNWRLDLAVVLRRYGFLGLDVENNGQPITNKLAVTLSRDWKTTPSGTSLTVILADGSTQDGGLDQQSEAGGSFLYGEHRSWFRRPEPAYRTLLDHFSFSGEGLTSILRTETGRTVVGWWNKNGNRYLVIGLRVVDELVRYTQGDPEKVISAADKTLWGSGHERPAYLFEDNIVKGYELVPWADRLGYLLVRLIADASGLPLLSLLPGGASGGVLLTGDDDQAYLEKYQEQLGLLQNFPMTYLMLPHTRHTSESLGKMPRNVEFGVHVDALEMPTNYAQICKEQTQSVRTLIGKPANVVRNHGHLNSGYWGHLQAWEDCGLDLDLSIRGLDGTCPTGSYLPYRVRRPTGSWSSHISLFSTFSDSMFYLQKWSPRKQISCVNKLAGQISGTDPGIIVFNLHPQNVSDFHDLHRTVMALGRRKGWVALGAESYLDWLTALAGINLVETASGFELHSSTPIEKLAYTWPAAPGQTFPHVLPKWEGVVNLGKPVS